MSDVVMILGMALVTFAVRAGLLIAGDRIVFPPLLRRALAFVPVTVLTAIVAPMLLAPSGGDLELTWRNPQLVAGLAAIAVACATRRALITIAVGLGVYLGWRFLLLG